MPTKLDSLFIGAKHFHFYEIDSTNNYALNLLSKSTPAEGTLVTADFQTHGRGQYGRDWLSNSTKNLLLSIILYPDFLPAIEQFHLSKSIALAVQSSINSYLSSKAIRIKWPNDIFCENKKIGGILIQNLLTGAKINASVIGIGINVNQDDFPEEFFATSIIQELGIAIEKKELLDILLADIKTEYMILRQNHQIQDKRYNDLLFGRNEEKLFEDKAGNRFVAKVLFINREGNLILEKDDKYVAYSFGELTWIKE